MPSPRVADMQGIAQLATEATLGVTRIVEGVHQSVWRTVGFPGGATEGQTRGITGLVYRSIEQVTQLAGRGSGQLLALLEPLLRQDSGGASTNNREALLAALNGVMGDQLVERRNPLATPMSFRSGGLRLEGETLAAMPGATGKIMLLVHGLCMNDLQWQAPGDGAGVDHGKQLAALGYTPVYLRYNSGLHISCNGRELSDRLDELLAGWPVPVQEIAVVAHSLGGLVARGAVHFGRAAERRWPSLLKHMVFLGTPHHGAPLERAGNWVDVLLAATPWSAPLARIGQLRSAGITDLRHGNVLDEDWQGHSRFERRPDSRQALPLPDRVACYTVAATTAQQRSALADRLVGDGLVPLRSALGQAVGDRHSLVFPVGSTFIAHGINHMALLHSPAVARQMLRWLATGAA